MTRTTETLPPPARLSPQDAGECVKLSDVALWNQTVDDWRFLLENSEAWGIRTAHGEIVASAVALPYSADLRWIAMVLVRPDFRRMGLASALLDKLGPHEPAALDATDQGSKVYEHRGFKGGPGILRLRGHLTPSLLAAPDTRGIRQIPNDATLDDMAVIDGIAYGGPPRPRLLRYFNAIPGGGGLCCKRADGSGAVWMRPGRRAWHVGPLIASTPALAADLFATRVAGIDGEALIDVPAAQVEFVNWLQGHGFTTERTFIRMNRGMGYPPAPQPTSFATAGPEFG